MAYPHERETSLSATAMAEAHRLFVTGMDTFDIAWKLEATEAAIYNAIHYFRETIRQDRKRA